MDAGKTAKIRQTPQHLEKSHKIHYAKEPVERTKEVYMTLEIQHIKRLYELLEQLEDAGKPEDAAVMRWAIFELERKFNIKIGNLDEE